MIFVPPYVRRPFDYYRRRLGRGEGPPVVVFPSDSYRERWPARDLAVRLAVEYRGVWVVLSHERTSARDLATAQALVNEDLPRGFDAHDEVAFDGIRILHFARSPPGDLAGP